MDYETKSVSRNDLRRFAAYFRKLFDVPNTGAFPVLEALDKISDVFKGCDYIIVEDNQLPPKTMAQCYLNENGGFTIEIKETVYWGAYNGIGAYNGFICHELSHVFLFKIGYTPKHAIKVGKDNIPAYRKVEWQAKALCAEVMIPFEESSTMNVNEIEEKYNVSKAFAEYRLKLGKEKKNKNSKKTH